MVYSLFKVRAYPDRVKKCSVFRLCFLGCLLCAVTSCSILPMTNTGGKITLTLWYKNHSIDDTLLTMVSKRFPNIILKAEKVGMGFDSKFRTALAGQTGVPDMVGLNTNIATYFPDENQFVNLYTLGAHTIQNEYLAWKWQQAQTPDGKLLALPMDTGPTALFYRTDIFQQAGLPTQPAEVSAQLATWDAYIHAAQAVQRVTHGKSYLIGDLNALFNQILGQEGQRYFDPSGRYIGAQSSIQYAWNMAVKIHQLHLSAGIATSTTDWSAAISNGTLVSFIGAVWMKNYLEASANSSAGLWRVARAPGGDGNDGGSFLALTKYSPHPRQAYAVMQWLLSPQNQLQSFHALNLFPSTPGVFTNPAMSQIEPFFGGQNTSEIFSEAARNVKPGYFGPDYDIVNAIFEQELLSVDILNTDPQMAWQHAQQQVMRELSR